MSKAVEEMATPAGALSGRQGEGQASKQEHTKHLRVDGSVQRRGATRKRESSKWTTLAPEEGAGSRRETRPHGGAHEEVVGFLGGLPLPTLMPRTNIFEIRESLWPQPIGQASHSGGWKSTSFNRSLAASAPRK